MRDLRSLPIGELVMVMLAAGVAATFAAVFIYKGDRPTEAQQPAAETSAAAPASPPSGGGLVFDVDMGDNFFAYQGKHDPAIPVPSGKEATVNLANKGRNIHNMRIAGADSKYDNADDFVSEPDLIRTNGRGTLKFKFDKAGAYDFRCDFHPDTMTGTITVQ